MPMEHFARIGHLVHVVLRKAQRRGRYRSYGTRRVINLNKEINNIKYPKRKKNEGRGGYFETNAGEEAGAVRLTLSDHRVQFGAQNFA